MSQPSSNDDLHRRPRKRRRPSERNRAIHQAYRTGLRSQGQLAEEFGITQCRVSRIVANVDQWLASGESRNARDPDEQARLEWRLERLRIGAILETALRTHVEMPREVRSSRSHVGRSDEMREETCREIAPSPPPCEQVEPSNSAHVGPTNWHEWHTPLGADQVATHPIGPVPQGMAPQQVGA